MVGARPQFIKAAPVSAALRTAGVTERLVHTGQHYDDEMSRAFFESLGLPAPEVNLEIGSAPHGAQTGRMLEALEQVILHRMPGLVLVYGDTNSTLAAALAAAKAGVPVAHVEAGLRSFDREMPEEINRVVTDHLASLLFAPTGAAVENLGREGITTGVVRTGDVMFDAFLRFRPLFETLVPEVLSRFGLGKESYAVLTIHRAENTGDLRRLEGFIRGLGGVLGKDTPIVWPVHPRLRAMKASFEDAPNIVLTEPLAYLEMQALLSEAAIVLTDSGGLQKEAAFHGVPCITLREETEWVELVEAGVNQTTGLDPGGVHRAVSRLRAPSPALARDLYGDGNTAGRIAGIVADFLA